MAQGWDDFGRCSRCLKQTGATVMSRFNTEIICFDCEAKERRHPLYQKAVDAEAAACRSGNYNYPGIGKPSDL